MIERNAIPIIREIIEPLSKMAFVSGPRQIGFRFLISGSGRLEPYEKGVSKKLRTNGLTHWIIPADQWLLLLP
jgi:hypothetical protein